MNRRSFPIGLVLALLIFLGVSTGSRAADRAGDFKGPIGLQLYALRESFKTDVPGRLDKVKALGFVEIEGGDVGLSTPVNCCRQMALRTL